MVAVSGDHMEKVSDVQEYDGFIGKDTCFVGVGSRVIHKLITSK